MLDGNGREKTVYKVRHMLIAKDNRRKFWLILTVVYMGELLYFSAKTEAGLTHATVLQQFAHNFLHIPAYGLLTILLIYLCRFKTFIWPVIISCAYGAFNEFVQSFIPGRTASVMDIFLNMIGACFALLFFSKGYLKSLNGDSLG